MSIASFYCPELQLNDVSVELDSSEAAHAVKARRLRHGDDVRLFNGNGVSALGHLSTVERRHVVVELDSFSQHEAPQFCLSIAVAIPKGDRQKVLVDMLTQLGIFEIIPLCCDRSVTKFSKNTIEKWQRGAIEACKQSQNPWLPKFVNEASLDDLLKDSSRTLYYADASGANLKSFSNTSSNITLIIGPEGGFSPREFDLLEQACIPSFKVGPYILRTEAAAIAAASAFIA